MGDMELSLCWVAPGKASNKWWFSHLPVSRAEKPLIPKSRGIIIWDISKIFL